VLGVVWLELVEDELLGVVVLLGVVALWLWFMSVEEEEDELELDGVVELLGLVLLGLVPAAAP
jgi:hypothetical protein